MQAGQALKEALKKKTRWIEIAVRPEETGALAGEIRAALAPEVDWLVPEQLAQEDIRDALRRSRNEWAVLDAIHVESAAFLESAVKAFLYANPAKRLVVLIGDIERGLRVPAHLGRGVRVASGRSDDALTASDRELLAHTSRIEPKYKLSDFVSGPKLKRKLEEAMGYIRTKAQCEREWGFRERHSRGHAVTLLFHGESGTGKTMAAEVLSAELEMPLYQVDLSAIVSKYIGETEKHLKRIFALARANPCILLFDEGDALFGQRTEVKGSTDRYANMEVNFLLQEIERFDGVVILSTNHERYMDPAFLRRFTYAVPFGRPSREMRRRIWQVNVPERLPLSQDVDFDYLSRFNLTGGNIRNCVRDAAAFAAADGRRSVGQVDFVWAVKRELQKHGVALSREMISDDRLWRRVGSEWETTLFRKAGRTNA